MLADLGITHRAYAELRISDRLLQERPEQSMTMVDKDLTRGIAKEVTGKLRVSKTPETKVYHNVPEETGVTIIRAEVIAFSPAEFDEFLEKYRTEVIKDFAAFGGML